MKLSTVNDWLAFIASINSLGIDLGLERVRAVAAQLGVLKKNWPLIMVGGTNGKGTTVATLTAIYVAAGYRVGSFTSPFLFEPTEQVCINGVPVTEHRLCLAFERVEANRGHHLLTPFEFFTLAALLILKSEHLDVLILEVGLGGRLDAVNILDADVAIVTSIDLDHTEWLGQTREAIAQEKAGIFRPHCPAIYGDLHPPQTLLTLAAHQAVPLYRQGVEFNYVIHKKTWDWHSQNSHCSSLPLNGLLVSNLACALMAVSLLSKSLPLTLSQIKQGLRRTRLPGRLEVIQNTPLEIHDVSHNPAAVKQLVHFLQQGHPAAKTHGVFSMLLDKDIASSVQMIASSIDHWYVAPLHEKRGAPLSILESIFKPYANVQFYSTIEDAYQAAKKTAMDADRIVVFGSFRTVAKVKIISLAKPNEC